MNNISTELAKVLPSTAVITPAASEGTRSLVPGFNLNSPQLRELIDQHADYAAQGRLQIERYIEERAAPEVRPLLMGLLGLFQEIGLSADETDPDAGNDLRAVWGLRAAA